MRARIRRGREWGFRSTQASRGVGAKIYSEKNSEIVTAEQQRGKGRADKTNLVLLSVLIRRILSLGKQIYVLR